MNKNNSGITLIALVITIIILLILAGVSIAMLTGENGILNQANEAKKQTEVAKIEENEKLNEYHNYITKQQYGVPIPQGFYYVGGKKEEGIVVSDQKEDENKYKDQIVVGTDLKGNQFVWIPVENFESFKRINGYSSNTIDTKIENTQEAGKEGDAITSLESKAMYKSVFENKGFYIARYEAGVFGTTTSTTTQDDNKKIIDGTVKPISQKGTGVWNQIEWGGKRGEVGTDGLPGNDNANGAVKVARSMYGNSKEKYGVISTLCYDVQWDAALTFMDNNFLNSTCTDSSYPKNSTGKGNYTNSIAVSGEREAYHVKNIYDMAGNLWEWTMGGIKTLSSSRMIRGGCYNNSGYSAPASNYTDGSVGGYNERIGFRVALYL